MASLLHSISSNNSSNVLSCLNLPQECSDIIYIGRPRDTPVPNIITTQDDWGNPFRMQDSNDEAERSRILDCYKMFLLSRPDLIKKARNELKSKRLACWCKPMKCHGDILSAFANSLSDLEFMKHILASGIASIQAIEQYATLGIDLNIVVDADPLNKEATGTTAVGIAAKLGDIATLNLLIAYPEVDLNKGRGSSSPLLLAAAYGHTECVRILMHQVSCGRVNVSATRRDGVSALVIACQQGNAAIVRLLLRNAKGQFSKINVNQRTLFPERVTSLLLSIRTGSLECVQLLMDHPGLSLEDNMFQRQTAVSIAQNMQRKDIADVLLGNTNQMELMGEHKVSTFASSLPPTPTSLSSSVGFEKGEDASIHRFRFPPELQMNKMCRMAAASKQLPLEVIDWIHQKYQTGIKSFRNYGKGWHEIYVLTLETSATRLMLRIYRNQLSYWKFNECSISAKLEQQAAQICNAAGIPTPNVLAIGKCDRKVNQGGIQTRSIHDNNWSPSNLDLEQTQEASWSISEYVKDFSSGRRNSTSNKESNVLSILKSLFNLPIQTLIRSGALNVDSIPMFNNVFEHLDYLEDVARRYDGGGAISQHIVASVKQLFHTSNITIIPPRLVHYDLHGGNVSLKPVKVVRQTKKSSNSKNRNKNNRTSTQEENKRAPKTRTNNGGVRAVIDWEFAGIVDPRLELIKLTLDWAVEKRQQNNQSNSSGSSSSGSSSSDEDNHNEIAADNQDIEKIWSRAGMQCFGFKRSRLGPWFPWAVLHHTINFVFGRALLRLCRIRQKVPRCDLNERIEDCRRSGRWLTCHGIIDVSKFDNIYEALF